MIWYYYLNYKIYKFYVRKRESMPSLFSFLGSVALLFFNIFTILAIVDFFYPFLLLGNKYYVLVLMGMLAIFNYLVLYRGEYYKEVFEDFDRTSDRYKHWNKYVSIYIISSIFLFLVVLLIADYRFDGHL